MDTKHVLIAASILLLALSMNLKAQNGTAESPYPINNSDALKALRECMNSGQNFYFDAENQTFTATKVHDTDPVITKNSSSTCYKLTADIDLNPGKNVAACDGDGTGLTAWEPFKNFHGQLDGGHHVVSGVYVSQPAADSVGFIKQIHGSGNSLSRIRNLGIVNSYISGKQKVGGLVGYMEGGSVEHCFVDAVLVGDVQEVGGLIGYASGITITDCYATGSITCIDQGLLGGICGASVNLMKLENCYSSMVINYNTSLTSNVGGIIGQISSESTISQCYFDNQMCESPASDNTGARKTTSEMLSESFCQSLGSSFVYSSNHYPRLTGFSDTNSYILLSTTPILLGSGQSMKNLTDDFEVSGTGAGTSWESTDSYNRYAVLADASHVTVIKEGWLQLVAKRNGKTHTVAFYTHKAPFIGTEQNPFPIDDFEDLKTFRDGVNSDKKFNYKHFSVNALGAGTWFQQTADISLSEVNNWKDEQRIGISPAIAFKGGYDGGNHKITDLRVNGGEYIKPDKNVYNYGGSYSGFFGFIDGGTVKNLNLYVTEFKPNASSGPLCAYISRAFTIENCHVYPTAEQVVLNLHYYSGGLIGQSDSARGTISNCSNHCNIVPLERVDLVGGIIGPNRSIDSLLIKDCQNFGAITGKIQRVAGITPWLGGRKGGTKAEILRCKNFADLFSNDTWTRVAGILSENSNEDNNNAEKVSITISFCENYGNLTATYRAAGIASTEKSIASLHHCVNAGDIWIKDLGQEQVSNAYGITTTTDVYSCLNAGNIKADRGGSAFGLTNCGAYDCMNAGELSAHSEGPRTYPFCGWNGTSGQSKRNINIGRANGVVTYWGATSNVQKQFNICDEQMIYDAHSSLSNNTAKKTSEMLGNGLQSLLGTENWVYAEGMYPRIKGLDTLPISIVTAMPVVFKSGETINSVKTDFTVAGGDTVSWTCKGNTVLSGNNATVSSNVIGMDTLVAIYKGAAKTVRFCRYAPAPSQTLEVTSIEDLRVLRDGINSAAPFNYKGTIVPAGGKGAKFKQTQDIEMESPTDDNWMPVGKIDAQFYGKYDGGSHSVSNMKQHNMLNGGLFGYVCGISNYAAEIHDVHLVNVKISEVRASAGALVAVSNYVKIYNCSASGEITGTTIANNKNNVDNNYGGIVGNGYVDQVTSCVNYCTITGYSKSSVGGIMGRGYYSKDSYLDSCANYGTITGNYCVGGLVGQQQSIRNSYNAGEVSGGEDAAYVGGLAGHATLVTNSFNTGMVSGVPTDPTKDYSVGGLIGEVRNADFSHIHNCYNAGIVDGNNRKYVGGIFGSSIKQNQWGNKNDGANNVRLSRTYVSNAVNGTGLHVGAIVGYNVVDPTNSKIDSNYYDTTFTYVGGIDGKDISRKAVGLTTDLMVSAGLRDSLGAGNFTYGDTNYYPRLTGGATPDWPATLASAAKLQLGKDEDGAYELAKAVTVEQFPVGGCSDGVSWSQRNGNQIEFNNEDCTIGIRGMGVLYIQSSHSGKNYKIIKLNVGNSAKNPLVIKDSLELVHFRDLVNAGDTFYYNLQTQTFHASPEGIDNVFPIPNQGEGLFFKLTCDVVDFKGADTWIPIGTKQYPFKGFFNGGGHTITRLNLTSNRDTVGFFGYLGRGLTDRGSIDSLYFTDVQLGGTGSVKGVVCAYNDGGIITGCRNNNATITHSGSGSAWGGICGYSHAGEIIGCSNSGCTIGYENGSTAKNVGGILGFGYNGAIIDCKVTGLTVSNTTGINNGGICGFAKENSISGCIVDGSDFTFSHNNSGGICGFDSLSSVVGCAFLNSSIRSQSKKPERIGGILGFGQFNSNTRNLTISDCHTGGSGSITLAESDYVGGIIGKLDYGYVTVSKCSNSLPVVGRKTIGGIGGSLTCNIDSCYNTASITAYTCVGGLVGQGDGAELNCSYNLGDIKAGKASTSDDEDPENGDYTGGLIGRNNSYHIHESFNSGIVSGTDYVGGLAGETNGQETSSYNAGQVYGSFYVGGISGLRSNNADVSTQNYNIGYIDGNNIAGALYGSALDLNKVTDNYYDKQFSFAVGIGGEDIAGKAEGKLTTEMTGTSLGLGDKWEYTANLYPQVKALLESSFASKASKVTASPFILYAEEVAWDIVTSPLTGVGSAGTRWRTENGSSVLTTTDNMEFQIHRIGFLNIEAYDPASDSVYKRVRLMVEISEERPIEIKDYNELKNFRNFINANTEFYYDATNKTFHLNNPSNAYIEIPPCGEGMYFKLLQDIDLATFSGASPWKPIGINKNIYFKGHFNGNGKVISNMVVTTKSNQGGTYNGFFGYSSGTIKNLTMANANVKGSGYNATVCGFNRGGSILNCAAVGGSVTGTSTYTGGICGRSQNGTLNACYSSCDVNGCSWVGGIAGRIENGVTSECFNMGRVTDKGFVPKSGGTYQVQRYCGGITGQNSSFLSDCYNTGIVSGERWVGGIIGLNEKEGLSRVYNAGTVIVTETPNGIDSLVGGLTNINNVETNNLHYPQSSATSRDMAPDVLTVNKKSRFGQCISTEKMVADSLRQIFGDDKWVFSDSLYPRLKVFVNGTEADAAASLVSATPVFLQGNQPVTDVSSSFITYNKNGVTWELAKPSNALDTTKANYPNSGWVDIRSCDLVSLKVYKGDMVREVDINVRSENTYVQKDTTCGVEPYFWTFNNSYYYTTGIYSESIDNGSLCNEKMNLDLVVPAPLNITLTPSVSCHGSNQSSITATVSGGLLPGEYSYSWKKVDDDAFDSTSASVSNLGPGTYTLTVTDLSNTKNCSVSQTVTIDEPTLVTVENVTADGHCYNSNDGTLSFDIAGGEGPYSISWTTPVSSTTHFEGSANQTLAGKYSMNGLANDSLFFTVADRNGCSVKDTIVIADGNDTEYEVIAYGINKKYDGIAVSPDSVKLKADGVEKTGWVKLDGNHQFTYNDTTFTVELSANSDHLKDAGIYANNIISVTVTKESEDITCRLNLKKANSLIVIEKRDLVLQSGTTVEWSSGIPNHEIYNHNVLSTAESEHFVNGDTVSYSNWTSQVGVGSRRNTFDIVWPDNVNQNNYSIRQINGVLTILKEGHAIVSIDTNSKMYDGTPLYATYLVAVPESTVVVDIEVEDEAGVKRSLNNLTAGANIPGHFSRTDAGTTNLTITKVTVWGITDPSNPINITGQYSEEQLVKRNGQLTVTPRPIKLVSNSATKEYDDSELKDEHVTVVGGFNGCFADSLTDLRAVTTIVNAGQAPNEIEYTTKPGFKPDNFIIDTVRGTLTITKRPATLLGESSTEPYTGSEQCINGITPSGLLSGHTLDASGIPYSACGLNPGDHTGGFNGTAKIKKGDMDVTSNYELTRQLGTLRIVASHLPIVIYSLTSHSDYYDGQNHKYQQYGVTNHGESVPRVEGPDATKFYFKLPSGDTITITPVNGGATGLTHVSDTDVVNDFNYTLQNSENYSKPNIYKGTFNLKPRHVIVASKNWEKVYDGQRIARNEATIAGMGFVNDEGLTDISWSQMDAANHVDAGNYENRFDEITFKENTRPSDYRITSQYGTLTINKATLTVTANDTSHIYGSDAPAPETLGYTISGFVNNEQESTLRTESKLSGHATLTSSTDNSSPVGSNYAIVIKSAPAPDSLVANNYNFRYVNGRMVVMRRPVYISPKPLGADSNLIYDGTVHSVPADITGEHYTVEGLREGDAVSNVNISGAALLAGHHTNAVQVTGCTIKNGDEDVTGSYQLVSVDTFILILPKPLKITVSKGGTHAYDGQPHAEDALTEPKYTIDDDSCLVSTDAITNITFTGGGTSYSETPYPVYIDLNTLFIRNGDLDYNVNVKDCYKVICDTGDISITKSASSINILSGSAVFDYTGSAHQYLHYTVEYGDEVITDNTISGSNRVFTLPTGDKITVTPTAEASITNPSQNPVSNTFTYLLDNAESYLAQPNTTYGTLSINNVPQKLEIISGSQEYNYDGTSHSFPYYTVRFNNVTIASESSSASILIPTGHYVHITPTFHGITLDTENEEQNNSFSYTVTNSQDATGPDLKDMYSDAVATFGTVSIKPGSMTVSATTASKPYDGEPLYASGNCSMQGATLWYSTDNGQTWQEDVPGITVGTLTYKVKATLPGYQDAVSGNATLTVTGNTVAISVVSGSHVWEYDGQSHTKEQYTVNYGNQEIFSPDEGTDGKVFTLPTGDKLTVTPTFNGITHVNENSDHNNTFTFTIQNNAQYAGQRTPTFGTLKINPTALEVHIKGNTGVFDYNNTLHTVEGYTVDHTNNSSFSYQLSDCKYRVDEVVAIPSISRTEAGLSYMGLDANNFQNLNPDFNPVTFTVTDGWVEVMAAGSVVVHITGHHSVAEYDGQQHSVSGYDLEISNPSGLPFTVDNIKYTGDSTASRQDVGTTQMEITPELFQKVNTSIETVEFILVEDGYMEITPSLNLTLTCPDNDAVSKTYDGNPLSPVATSSPSGEQFTIKYRPEGSTEWTTTPPSIRNYGNLQVDVQCENPNYQTKTCSYNLSIHKRVVVLTSADSSRVYDGTPLVQNKVNVSGSGFVGQEGASYTVTGQQLNAGTSANTFTYTLNDGTLADNYAITTQPGTLTVTKRDVTVAVGDAPAVEYNGNEHQGLSNYSFDNIVEGQVPTIAYTPAKGTLPGLYTGSFGDDFKVMADNTTDVTANYNLITRTPGSLNIVNRTTPYEITVVANSSTGNVYDGTAKSATGFQTLSFTVAGNTYTVEGLTTSNPSSTDVCNLTNAVSGTAVVKDVAGNDVTAQFNVATTNGTLSITPATLTVTTGSATREYNGTALTASGSISGLVTPTGGTQETATFAVTGSQTAVGGSSNTYTLTWDGTAKQSNYTLIESLGTLTVTKNTAQLYVESKGKSWEYDGNAHTNPEYVVHFGEETVDAAASANSGTYTATLNTGDVVTITPSTDATITNVAQNTVDNAFNWTVENESYYTKGTDAVGKLSINHATLTITADNKNTEYGVLNHDFTYTPSGFKGEDNASVISGTVSYTGEATTTTTASAPGLYTITPVVTGLSAANYSFTPANGTLTIGNSTTGISITSPTNSWTYDGTPHFDHGYTVTFGQTTLTATHDNGSYKYTIPGTGDVITVSPATEASVTNYTSSAFPNSFTYTVTNAERYPTPSITTGTLTVTKRDVTVAVGDAPAVEYNGNEHQGLSNYSFDNIVEGQVPTIAYTPAKGTLPGLYTGSFGDDFKVMADNTTDVTANYNLITRTPGSLNIVNRTTPYEITVVANSSTGNVYDGTAKSATGFQTLSFTVAGNTYTVEGLTTSNPSSTDVCNLTNAVSGTAVVKDVAGNDVTAQFNVATTNGTLSITPATLTVTTGSATREYNGTALTASGSISGLVTPTGGTQETATFAVTGSQTAVGGSSNTYTLTWDGTAKQSNYTLIESLGTLTVTKNTAQLYVESKGKSWEYDGNAHTNPEYVVHFGEETVDAAASANSGTYTATLNTGDVVTITPSTDATITNVAQNTVDNAFNWTVENESYYTKGTDAVGKLSINHATLTITADNKNTEYGVLNHDFTYTPSGFKGEDNASVISGTVSYTGEATTTTTASAPGLYTITPVVTGLSAANYSFTPANGTLTIGNSTTGISITSPTNSWTYDGTPHFDHGYTVTFGQTTLTATHDNGSYKYTIPGTGDVITVSPATEASVTNYTSSAFPNSFTYTVTNAERYPTPSITTGTLTISKRPVTFTGKSETRTYTGSTITINTVEVNTTTISGLVSGHTHNVTFSASGTEAGSYPGTITAAGDVVIKIGETYVTGNYDITVNNGTLTVSQTDGTFDIALGNDTLVYDAQPHANAKTATSTATTGTTTFSYSFEENGSYTTDLATLTKTDAGEYNLFVKGTNPNYTHTATATAKLVISKRPVTFTGKSETRTYTGSTITINTVEVNTTTISGLVSGHTHNVTFSASGTEAGSYPGTITAAGDVVIKIGETYVTGNYDITVNNGTLTVSQTDGTFDIALGNDTLVYDAQPHANAKTATSTATTGTTTFSYSFEENGSYTTDLATLTKTDAGEYNLFVKGTNPNYTHTATATAKLVITKRPITVAASDTTVNFNGILQHGSSRYTFSGLVEGHSATIGYTPASGTDISPTPYDNGSFDAGTIRVMNGGTEVTSNYVLTALTPGKLTVKTPPLEVKADTLGKTYDGLPLTATYTHAPADAQPSFRFKVKIGDTWGDYTTVTPAITTVGSITYLVEATANSYTVSDTATLTVTPCPITIRADNKTKTYGDTDPVLTATVIGQPEHGVPPYFDVAREAGQNVGEYRIAVSRGSQAPAISNYAVTLYDGVFTINKRPVTVAVADSTVEYTGGIHYGHTQYMFSNVVSGQTASITYTPASGTTLGEYTGQYVESSFSVVNGTDVTPNYELTAMVPGRLNITGRADKYKITVTAKSDTDNVYDGQTKSVSGFNTLEFQAGGHAFTVSGLTTGNPSAKDAGSYPNTVSGTPVVTDAHGNIVTSQFVVHTEDGLLRIDPRHVILESEDGEKIYDGNPLTRKLPTDIAVTGDGFVDGEGATYQISGAQTLVGTSPNTFTYTLNNGTLASNYTVETVFGTLKVTSNNFPLSILSVSDHWLYDGELHKHEEYVVRFQNEIIDSLPGSDGNVFVLPTNDTLTITPTFHGITHVSQNTDSNNTFTYSLQHNDQYTGKRDTLYGTLAIWPANVYVLIYGNAEAVTYDGLEHTVTGYHVDTISKPLYNINDFTFNGSPADTIVRRTESGVVQMNIDASKFVNHNPDFTANFRVHPGALYVVPINDVGVIVRGNHRVNNYDGSEHVTHGYTMVSTNNPLYQESFIRFTGTPADSTAARTTQGTTRMGLTEEMFTNDNPNFDNVRFSLQADGAQTISASNVTVMITGHHASNQYDGLEHSVSGYDVFISNSLYTADKFSYTGDSTATRRDEGTTWMELDETDFVNNDTNFSVVFYVADGYQDINLNHTALTLTCPGGDSTAKVYDGTPLTARATATSTIAGDEFLIEYKTPDSDWSITPPSITDHGLLEVEVRCTNPNYHIQTCSYALSVRKRPVVLVSADSTRMYNGGPLTRDSVRVEGLGFAAGEGATCQISGTQTLVGASPNTFTYTLNDGTSAANYTVETVYGTLTVTNRPDAERYVLPVVSKSGQHVYDGLKHTVSGFDTLIFTTSDGYEYSVENLTAQVSAFDAGVFLNAINGEAVVRDANGNDVTAQFSIERHEGQLVITRRPVTITIPELHNSKMYDGEPLKVGYQNILIDNLAARDTLTAGYIVTEGYTVGDYVCEEGNFMVGTEGVAGKHDFAITHGATAEYAAGNSLGNYIPRFNVTLSITERPLEITANSAEKVYDGLPLSLTANDFTMTGGTTLATGDTVIVTREGLQTCVGEIANSITAVNVYHKSDGEDVTASYGITTVNGLLKVTPETDGFVCPEPLHIILTEGTSDTLVPDAQLGTAVHSLVTAGMASMTNDLADLNPLTVGTHIVTWTLYDGCDSAMTTCEQTVVVDYSPCEGVTYHNHFYDAKRIGYQCWMTENLQTSRNSSDTEIADYHAYKDNAENLQKFGYLYSWYSAMNVTENDDTTMPVESLGDNGRPYVQGICPDGWAVGNAEDFGDLFSHIGDVTLLKDAGEGYWIPNSGGVTPNSGFNARANGWFNSSAQRYEYLLTGSYFWMPESDSSAEAYNSAAIEYHCGDGLFQRHPRADRQGVRCIRKVAP